MYAAIYSYTKGAIYREHLGNITNPDISIAQRTYDFGGGSISGFCNFSMEGALLYVVNDDYGHHKYSGFVKSIKPGKEELISFIADDFKRILDTEIILDFSNDLEPDFTVHGILTKAMTAVLSNKDPFISLLPLAVTIPADTTITTSIADYTGQYLVVNALAFLKVYLSYYGYHIEASYDVALDKITFEFKKASTTATQIKLKDFVHEKTSNDIKVNKTVATIAFKTVNEGASWIASTLAYYNSQLASNRAAIIGTTLPDTEGYAAGFALKMMDTLQWASATSEEYNNAPIRTVRYIQQYNSNVCYTTVGYANAVAAAGDANGYTDGTVVAVYYQVFSTGQVCYGFPTYIKAAALNTEYHQLSSVTFTSRPALPEKIYTLGKDNAIYEGYAPEGKRIYPIVSKVFEASYLSEAQLNAVYELVNNRYVENIIIRIEDLQSPMDLAALSLNTMLRVYDDEGAYKDTPVSEKNIVYNMREAYTTVKLGFKKTLLTEIIKNDIGAPNVVKGTVGGGGGATTVVDYEIWEGTTAPDPGQYDTWFRQEE